MSEDDDWPPRFKIMPDGAAAMFITAHANGDFRTAVEALTALLRIYYDKGAEDACNKYTEKVHSLVRYIDQNNDNGAAAVLHEMSVMVSPPAKKH